MTATDHRPDPLQLDETAGRIRRVPPADVVNRRSFVALTAVIVIAIAALLFVTGSGLRTRVTPTAVPAASATLGAVLLSGPDPSLGGSASGGAGAGNAGSDEPAGSTPRPDAAVVTGGGVGSPLRVTAGTLHGWAKVDPGQGRGHAAAGPALRRWLGGGWRGTTVTVWRGHAHVTVVLSDFCRCNTNPASVGLIDMDEDDFRALTGRGPGKAWVRITVGGRSPSPTLPPTDTAP